MSPNIRGALIMMGSMAAFTFNDALMKQLGGSVPLFQLITMRGVLTCVLLYFLARYLGKIDLRIPKGDRLLVVIRCAAEVATTYFFLNALMNIPLANVTAVLQALPLTVTLGAAVFFGERVGWRRFLAIGIGFGGMLLIVRPGPDGFNIYSLYALAAMLLVTLRDLVTRKMSANVPSMTVTLATAVSVTGVAALVSTTETWVSVSPSLMALVATAAVFVLLGYMCSVMVMRVGDVSFVAPFRYTSLIWALLLGFVLFGDWPDPVTLLGASIVVATGLFTLFRERALLRR
ncbi:EamA-like transporter family protein [Falsiruegeria litorea R37]|uniref:EamA-like transporter family protein n=1 Tax=Falsiruegeria litorea R37 TaxID=1200284 RepID=A0A1Y5RFV0_9RHOB|nr:DMT family transporter [Falsiruegeria litorea]SLN16556.1 EamA-like transporter family protein [Falsiruegeria litorea R37]